MPSTEIGASDKIVLKGGGTPAHGFGGKGIERDPAPFMDPRSGYAGPAAPVTMNGKESRR